MYDRCIFLTEAILFSEDNYEYRVDDWIEGKLDRLFIIGYSGSGKTTLGVELGKEYNARVQEMDDLVIDGEMWEDSIKRIISDVMSRKGRWVFSGMQPIYDKTFDFENNAIIIMGTSMVKSSYRARLRGLDNGKGSLEKIIKNLKLGRYGLAFNKITGNFLVNLKARKKINRVKDRLSS
jgi:adenylate kinase family enzyme